MRKLISCEFNFDTVCVELQFSDGMAFLKGEPYSPFEFRFFLRESPRPLYKNLVLEILPPYPVTRKKLFKLLEHRRGCEAKS